jgi:hypothetical protein
MVIDYIVTNERAKRLRLETGGCYQRRNSAAGLAGKACRTYIIQADALYRRGVAGHPIRIAAAGSEGGPGV